MTVQKINYRAVCFDGCRSFSTTAEGKYLVDMGDQLPALEIAKNEAPLIEKVIGHLKRNRRAYAAACYFLATLLAPNGAFAAGMEGGKHLILLLQKASFWVGMGITIWGIVEAQLDFPGWKGRIAKGILGYIGILLVPLVFLELQESLQINVWDQIENAPSLENSYKVPGGQ